MLYLGHFSFAQESRRRGSTPPKPWHGYFTCVAEADEVEAAIEKFKALVRKLRDRSDMFSGVERIYLDSCIEIHSVPRGGFLAHFSLKEGEEVGGISTSIRGATKKQAVAFHLGSDDENEDDELHESEPFIVFRHTHQRDRGPK
jgi:hypothetical protein